MTKWRAKNDAQKRLWHRVLVREKAEKYIYPIDITV
jgi:hypothetical protein